MPSWLRVPVAPQGRTVEEKLAAIAEDHRGLVTHDQLVAAGISRNEIKHRAKIGSLIREHKGVYRVGHAAPSPEATYLAAVLAAGDGAVPSGRAAAWLLGLIKGEPPQAEVTTRKERRIEGVLCRCPR